MTYLDTHIADTLSQADFRLLGRDARRALNREKDIRISPIVILELEYLFEIGRLRVRPKEVVKKLGDELGLRVCDRPFEQVAFQATNESWTRDVFDRMIVAQARLANATLVTRDLHIHQHYARAIA